MLSQSLRIVFAALVLRKNKHPVFCESSITPSTKHTMPSFLERSIRLVISFLVIMLSQLSSLIT